MDTEVLETILKRKQKDSSIHRIISVEDTPAVPEGSNYLSSVLRVKANVVLCSGAKRTINVIVKMHKGSGPTFNLTSNLGIFNTEIKVYTQILQLMDELMYEFGDKRTPLWCDIYGHTPSTIIFQDLTESEFKCINRCENIDLPHAKMVVKNLARLHAMSRILIKRKQFLSTDLPPYPPIGNLKFAETLYAKGLRLLSKEMKNWESEWHDIADRLGRYAEILTLKFLEQGKIDESKFNVFCHADCWIANLMFKYDPYEKRPIDLRFVDFQFSHYQIYAWDLTFFLYTSLFGDFRRKYYDELVKDYAHSLHDNLLYFNYSKDETPDYDAVRRDMEMVQHLCIPFALVLHPIMTAPVKHSFNLDEGLTADKESDDGVNVEIFRRGFKDEIGPDIKRFAEIGLF